jgi:hypothetical protein
MVTQCNTYALPRLPVGLGCLARKLGRPPRRVQTVPAQANTASHNGAASQSFHASYRRVSAVFVHAWSSLIWLRLFNQTEFSDITLLIHGKPLPAHRFVICTQSKYFEKAFRNFAEGETRTMTLEAATEAAYWRVFKYLYTGDYPDDLPDLASEGK